MALGDHNGDGLEDLAIACGEEDNSRFNRELLVLRRTNRSGQPTYREVILDQPCGNFPKGVQILELNGDSRQLEILAPP
jgi:hypothetical protein